MKKMIYWWERLSSLMKLALLVGILWLLIVAGSAVIFHFLPPGWQVWAVVISNAFMAVVALLAAVISSREKLPGPKISPAKEDELLIVVAKFRGPESPDPQMYIARRLEADLLMHPALADRVRVSRFPEVIQGESLEAEIKRACALGETYGATLMIWGEHDGHSATPHYFVTRERERVATLVELEPRAATADLHQFVMYVSEELAETVTYLSLFTIGQIYYFANEYSKAFFLFSTALDHFPSGEAYRESAVALHFYRGTIYYRFGEHKQAVADYTEAIELKPDFAKAYNNRGAAYYDQGDYEQAIADYNKAIELKPDDALAHYNRGLAYADQGDYGRAIADWDKAIQINPQYAEAYNNRGETCRRTGDYDRAIADLTKAINLEPFFATAYYNRGLAYASKGEYDLAIADYDKAIELELEYAETYNNRGVAHYHKGEYDLAIADYDMAIGLKPNYAEAYSNRGAAYGRKGNYDHAIADCDKAVELKPDDAEAYCNRGSTYAERGKYDQAIADFDRCIKLKPDGADAYYGRGLVYHEKGDYDWAIADYGKAIELKPDYAFPYYGRGLAYKMRGEKDEAIRDFERFLELSEDEDWRRRAEEQLRELRGQ